MIDQRRVGHISCICFGVLGFVFATIADGARAADIAAPSKGAPAPPTAVAGWTYQITSYMWLVGINGSTTVRGRTTDVDASFIDLATHTRIPKDLFGAMAYFEARNDRFSVFADITYLQVGLSKNATRARQFAPELAASVDASLGLRFRETVGELAAGYEIARWAPASNSWTAIDVFAGGRFWWMAAEATLDVSATVTLPHLTFENGRAIAKSGNLNWVDPIIGIKLRHQFMPGHELALLADVGGFGVGSELTWQAVGAYSFDIMKTQNVTWSGLIGYRALFVDFEHGSGATAFTFDILQHGPILGLTARF